MRNYKPIKPPTVENLDTGFRLRIMRLNHGITRCSMAEKIGVEQSHLSRLEKDERKWRVEVATRYLQELKKIKRLEGVSSSE